jgi:hypothetical protein
MTALSETKQRLLNRLKSGAAPDRDPQGIPRRPAGNTAPQSMNQEQVWTHVQMMGDTPAYNELITLHRRGPLDIHVLERTLDEMNRRHEMWRTTFAMGEDEPEQIVHPSAPPVKLRLFDLRKLPLKDRAPESVRLASADASAPFRLKELPLWRAILVRMADEEYQLHLNLHQLLLDGVAVCRVLLPEVIAIYDAFSRGLPSPLPDPGPQYADYSVWQRRLLTNESTKEAMAPHLAYWKQKLANPAAPLSWPHFKPRPEVQTYRGATELLFLPSEVVDPLRALAARRSATLFMALATGFYVLMHRYTGQTDITLGTPAASRTPEAEGIMGYFLNMMPVRVDLSGNPTFNEALRRVRASVVDALEHGSVPLLRLLREIRPPHDPSRNPLFQIMISLEPPMPAVDPAWDLTQSGASSGSTKMDMYLNLDTRPDGLMAPIMYNPDLLDAASVRRMFADWRALLEAAIANPNSPIAPGAKPGLTARLRRWLGWREL